MAGKWSKFTLVSYNCLVDWHAHDDYGSRVDPQFLDADFRHALILTELEYLDGDIICLQEVTPEFYEKTLKVWSTNHGFGSAYIQRIHGRTDEGSAMFYKRDKFTCKRTELVQFKTFSDDLTKTYSLPVDRYTMEQEAIIEELEITETGHVVVVATTHLLFGDFRRPDVQILQISHLRHILKQRYEGKHIILCGDFNAEPRSLPYIFSKTGKLTAEQWNEMQEHSDIKECGDLFETIRKITEQFDVSEQYKSAYELVMGKEPDVTCVDHVIHCTLDYVLFRQPARIGMSDSSESETPNHEKSMAPYSVLNTMPLNEIEKELPPSRIYPSDHFPLFVKFAFVG